jgi:hypothetical protein
MYSRPWTMGLRLFSALSGCVRNACCALPSIGANTAAWSPMRGRLYVSNVTRTCGTQNHRLPAPVNPGMPTLANETGFHGEIGCVS